ncbi:tetratricopeptide repeat protein [Ornithinimicrobium cerasi]|uniref:tetratricopeptide repeat protein n=1 Tax=Ornithinimicrobium cerasi TaxID=2248773 RepID=UPI00137B7E16|nr:tetratricopeptide repeat protein [Ornithinimicrobium cerasi]
MEGCRTSTTLAALAQTQIALDEVDAAVAAAREALDLSLQRRHGDTDPSDAASARIAAEVLLRCGHAEYAYDALRGARLSDALSVTFALLASSMGEIAEAEDALVGRSGPLVASFRGYLHAQSGNWQSAVGDLRHAVNEAPEDVDSLFNLSISLWHLGAKKKATRAALRATRTAPGRKDISLHYLELLLAQGDIARATAEMASLDASGVVEDGSLLEMRARIALAAGEKARAVSLLEQAATAARREGDEALEGTVQANLSVLKYEMGRISRGVALDRLSGLLSKITDNDAIVLSYAQVAQLRSEAPKLRQAVSRLGDNTTPPRRAYFKHRIAVLEGENDAAGYAAEEWFELEPENVMSAAAAVVSIGIGQERWDDAVKVAEYALSHFPHDSLLLNNSAYVLAMSGRAEEAIRLLEPAVEGNHVLSATLGLAYLAHGDLHRGMRLYREAADKAEKVDPASRSLMTAYQALIVRELGIDKTHPAEIVSALALVPVDLPEDWNERSDFLRIYNVCRKHNYKWPLSL